jgi:acetylornithine deacetylase/succinyl-diaminopimelate desuccinylase-like protein
LHIEQGPVLERMGLPLGVVLGTKGVERHAVTFLGQEAHSGSTPMDARRDALAAAAKLALEIRSIARKHRDAVCTIGSVKTFPGIVTAVVGRCEAALDQRDLDAQVLAGMYREAQEVSRRFASEENCTVEWSRIWSIEPIAFHPRLLDLCEEAAREVAGAAPRLPVLPSGKDMAFIFSQVKADKPAVSLKQGEPEQVTITNGAQGSVTLSLTGTLPGVDVKLDHMNLGAGEKAVVTLRAGNNAKPGVLSLRVEQTNQVIPIQVRIE